MYARSLCSDCTHSVSARQRQAYARLYSHWVANDFHCAHSVLRPLRNTLPVDHPVLAASSAFLGGTVFTGKTCSVLTAGVMALGLTLGEIENSRLRVLRMITTMAAGGNAFEDRLNAFNKTMNLGHGLSQWFAAKFGSTQCRAIAQSDFSTIDGVRSYLDSGRLARCRQIACSVAERVATMIRSADRHRSST